MMARIVETANDELLVDFYRRHWLNMGIDESAVAPEWRAAALEFIANARSGNSFAGFVAVEGDEPVGGACCHVVARAYPAFLAADAARIGYVWGVYVRPGRRGRGIGSALVGACVSRLVGIGCGRVLLHAGDRSRPLYQRLGFRPTDELALDIDPEAPPQ
jgi:GNAT superfamily N-acetyltransferase